MPERTDKLKALKKNKKPEPKSWSEKVIAAITQTMPEAANVLAEPKWQRWTLIVGASLAAAFIIAPKSMTTYDLILGEPAHETVISPITFKVIDEAATKKNEDEVLKSVRPVYNFDDEMVHDVQARIDAGFGFMSQYLSREESKSLEDDKLPQPTEGQAPKTFRLLDDDVLRLRFENTIGASVSHAAFELLKSYGFNSRLQRDLRSLVVPILAKGVVQSRELLMRDGKQGILLKVKSKEKIEPFKEVSQLYDLHEAIETLNSEENDSTRDPALTDVMRRLARDLINVNISYDREKSEALKQEAKAQAKPVYFQVEKGEPIIREGEPVNEGHVRKFEGLYSVNPTYSRYMMLAGFFLLLVLLLRLSSYFSEKHLGRARYATDDLTLMCLLLLGVIIMMRFIYVGSTLIAPGKLGITPNNLWFVAPVATGAMLAALMVGAGLAFVFSAMAAIAAALTVEGDIYLLAYFFLSGIVGLHGMTRVLDRTSILRAGLVVGLLNMPAILAIKFALGQVNAVTDLHLMGLGFLSGVLSGILVSALAPLLEPLGYITNIKLLELANLNHPLLKEMSQEAPGTYHHSILVGNLAESAAELIGANPLLARVGAMYHDIGKVGKKTKPSYFMENQRRGMNPHDKLEPSMSALILVAHVKNGVEKAREHRVGAPIIDIIQQHHGTSLIKFFYAKAIDKAEKNHQTVSEDKYHYPGPRPQTKEAALVMLADVAEAACRSIVEPTPAQIQKRVQTLIMTLFTEGELDQSTLTLKDLHAITKSFVRALQGMLHVRAEYPRDQKEREQKESESHPKVNGDSHRQPTDKDRHKPGRPPEEGGANIKRLGL